MYARILIGGLLVLSTACRTKPVDRDGDGFIDCNVSWWPTYAYLDRCAPQGDTGYAIRTGFTTNIYGHNVLEHDCNEADPNIHPGAIEICDGLDNDCDGWWDEWGPEDGEEAFALLDCETEPDGFVVVQNDTAIPSDCDPWDAATYPGAVEILGDGLDNDCDGCVDEEDTAAEDCSDTALLPVRDSGCRCGHTGSGGLPIGLLLALTTLRRRHD